MTELATTDESQLTLLPPAQPVQSTARLMLREHAAMMGEAHQLAQAMVRTSMVPQRFQGKPDDAAAAILYGAELGLNPIQALQRVIAIHGMPTLEARTMVALLKRHGYRIRTTTQSDDSVTVEGTDLDGNTHTSTWTIERAKKAGYTRNAKYDTDPQAMLKAKAQAEVCRDMAPDVLMGMPYTREELESERFDEQPVDSRQLKRAAAPLTVQEIVVDPSPMFTGMVQDATTVEADEPTPSVDPVAGAQEPAAGEAKSNAEIQRNKWMSRLDELLAECGADGSDRLTVVARIAKTADLITIDALPDKQLRAVVNTMAAWSKAGTLRDEITELLNVAFLAALGSEGTE